MIETRQYTGQTVAVMGFGRSGRTAARALQASGARIRVWDDDPARRIDAGGEGFEVVDLTGIDWRDIACLLWSPGIPHIWPAPHPVARAARAVGVVPVCDVELLMQSRPVARCIGVTGTNGKSTTTALIAHILAFAGHPAAAGGNLGLPVLEFPFFGPGGVYVIELSSYQLELTPSLALDGGVLLNITPDHLHRHGGMEGYIAAKRRLFAGLKPTGTAVVGMDDTPSAAVRETLLERGFPVIPVSVRDPVGVHVTGGVLADENGEVVADLSAAPALPGRHNGQNAAAAFAATRALGVAPATIAAALRTFPGLAHRQELVAVIDGVRYVNDSKATNADATEKALTCYDALYWIAGGRPKEGGITALTPLFPRVRHAFLIGEAAPAFNRTLEGRVPGTQCGTLAVAVAEAHAMAARERIPGAVVLLSPACASWDQFESFEQRGTVFRELVAALPGRREVLP